MTTWWKRWIRRAPNAPMDCHQVAEVLQGYLDGEIDRATAERIEAHLDACRRCGLEADTYDRIKATIAAQRPEVPVESLDRLRDFGRELARGGDATAP